MLNVRDFEMDYFKNLNIAMRYGKKIIFAQLNYGWILIFWLKCA